MQHSKTILNAYSNARNYLEDKYSVVPEDYRVLLFLDPSLYNSVILQTTKAGTPRSMISSNELQILQQIKDDDYTPTGVDLFYGSRNSKLFFPFSSQNKLDQKVLEAKFVQGLSKALICEQTKSKFPDLLEKLYEYDTIIYNLFSNNVFEFVKEMNVSWVWQYFQDFTASIRLLSIYQLDNFYIPPNSIRSASMFYNYLMEIKDIITKRAKTVSKTPLFDLILNGFGDLTLNQFIKDTELDEEIQAQLKSNLGQPLGVVGSRFLSEYGENLSTIFENTRNLKSDTELTSIWNRKDTKANIEEIRDKLSSKANIWHANKESYWSDLWPLRASKFDKVSAYVGKIQRRKYQLFSELLQDRPLVVSHGSVQLKDREVAVLSIQEDTIGQEQLLILRNHLQARKDTFITPLPGLPDIIVFKKYAGMHVASYLGVADHTRSKSYPKSPYDLPLIVRAIQVTKRKGAYISEEREDVGKVDMANYENLGKLTEPQHRAIRYLIRQKEILQ